MAVIGKRTGEFLEQWKSPILVGGDDVGVLERPWNCNVRIVPANAAIMRRRIIIGDLVHHHDVILQGEESMGEAHRNVKLAPGFGRKFCRNMLTEGRRAASDIHGDIQNSPPQNGDQLGLGRRRKLEMQSAQRARPLGARLVVLDEAAGDANVVQVAAHESFAEPTAVVDVPFRDDNPRQVHQHRRLATQETTIFLSSKALGYRAARAAKNHRL